MAYKGYKIITTPFTADVYVTKGNTNIGTYKSLAEAKNAVDALTLGQLTC